MLNIYLGASGKIGKYLINRNKKNLFTYNSNKIYRGRKFDLSKDNFPKLIQNKKINSVILLSAISDPNICYKKKKYSEKINVINMIKIIDLLIKKNIYFIFFSTEFVYNGKKKYFKEIDKTYPINEYGRQKLRVEKYIRKKAKLYSIFRIGKTYGDKINDTTIITKILKDIKNNTKFFNVASDQFFSPLFVKDLKKIISYFIGKKIIGTFNIGGEKRLSRYEIANYIKKRLKKNLRTKIRLNKKKLIDFKFYDNRPLDVSMNINKLKKTINFKLSNFKDVADKIIINSKINEKKFN